MTVHARWYGDRAHRAARRGAADGLRAGTTLVFRTMLPRIPTDTTGLVDSARMDVDEGRLHSEIHVGEGLGDYPAIIHEKPEIHHNDGEAFFLGGPMRELRGRVNHLIAEHIRRQLR